MAKILPGGVVQTSQVTLPGATSGTSRLLPAGTKITVRPDGITSNTSIGNKVVVGGASLIGGAQGSRVVTTMPGFNGTVMPPKELTEKDVSRIWSNEDIKLKNVRAMSQPIQV